MNPQRLRNPFDYRDRRIYSSQESNIRVWNAQCITAISGFKFAVK